MLRPMTVDDADAVLDLMEAVWGADDRPPGLVRIRHLATTDPGGAWVTTGDDGAVDGAALALVREGLWGLSLLIVRPDRQSSGRGRELLAAAMRYGADVDKGIIIASADSRALRSYWRAGFTLRPAFDAEGPVRVRPPAPAGVREGRWPSDRDLVDAISRSRRGAAHGPDADALLAAGCRLFVHDGGGFAFARGGRAVLLAATDERIARELLRAVLHESERGIVWFIDHDQQWALDVVLAAGLELKPAGATCIKGEVGPMAPYLPSGAYL
jgi:GNAT superfamily N-acetyltransferase